MPSVGVFLRYTNPYLFEFREKPRKTPNGWVDKRDRELNPVPPAISRVKNVFINYKVDLLSKRKQIYDIIFVTSENASEPMLSAVFSPIHM